MMYRLPRYWFAAVVLASALHAAHADVAPTPDLTSRPDLQQFLADMVKKHGFEPAPLDALFRQVILRPEVIEAISRPAEAKPWYVYRPIFVTSTRISQGVVFWDKYQAELAHAQDTYGVPAEIIVAILGVETRYGQNKGKYRVLDALTTLALDYPKRADFFRSELEQYLLLTREENIDPLSITGSYAGAMGKPQFIASSYRRYAVDFDGDGKRDLVDNTTDAIGSVANYFQRHNWLAGEPIATRAFAKDDAARDWVNKGLKPHTKAGTMTAEGIVTQDDIEADELAALVAFETRDGPEYWLTLQNFYAITRYNHSELYALAVYQLSQAVRAQRNEPPRSD